MPGWTFLTNHARVLVCLAREPGMRLRDIASWAEITERAAHRIVSELEEEGYLSRHRIGARNFYEIHPDIPLRGENEGDVAVGDLLGVFLRREERPPKGVARS